MDNEKISITLLAASLSDISTRPLMNPLPGWRLGRCLGASKFCQLSVFVAGSRPISSHIRPSNAYQASAEPGARPPRLKRDR
jgi:hypothetical protein